MKGEASSHYYNTLRKQQKESELNWEIFEKSLQVRIEPVTQGMQQILQKRNKSLTFSLGRWKKNLEQ